MCLPACLGQLLGMWGRASPPYHVVDLVVPTAGHEHHLACLLRNLQRAAAAVEPWVWAVLQECRGGHIVGQATMTVP